MGLQILFSCFGHGGRHLSGLGHIVFNDVLPHQGLLLFLCPLFSEFLASKFEFLLHVAHQILGFFEDPGFWGDVSGDVGIKLGQFLVFFEGAVEDGLKEVLNCWIEGGVNFDLLRLLVSHFLIETTMADQLSDQLLLLISGCFEGIEGVFSHIFDGWQIDEVQGLPVVRAERDKNDQSGCHSVLVVSGDVAGDGPAIHGEHAVDERSEQFLPLNVVVSLERHHNFDFAHEGVARDLVLVDKG
jgi:hypothetical protein